MKQYYIYLTTHLTNGKKYIGQHYGELDDNYFGSGIIILKILKTEGTKNLSKEILCICSSREEADQKEKEYITLFNAVEDENFYNLSEGGTKGDGWRAYQAWIKNYPEEAKENWARNGKRLQEWRKNNPEEYYQKAIVPLLEGAKKWRNENPELVQEQMKKVNAKKEQWQKEHPEEHQQQIERWRKAGSDTNSKPIKCITTQETFESLSAAARAYSSYGVSQGNLSKTLKGERKSCGKINGKKLLWEFATE